MSPLPSRLLSVTVLLLAKECVSWTVAMHNTEELLRAGLTHDESVRLSHCPCPSNTSDKLNSWSLCLPVDFAGKTSRKEVFAFSVTSDDRWQHYDWDQLTTVAWNEDKQLLCHAHSKGVKVVLQHTFDDVDQLCNRTARHDWITVERRPCQAFQSAQVELGRRYLPHVLYWCFLLDQAAYSKIVENYVDGVNIDTEKPLHGASSNCLGMLVHELRYELLGHALTKNAQITFDVSWAPRGVDGRYYPWRELSLAADFLFVMSYDMRSQVYDACIAGANSPLALVKQGLQEFLFAHDVAPDKLVLGVPWYGYRYQCLERGGEAIDDASSCQIQPMPFFGAPCSDAAGRQIDYGDIRRLVKSHGLVEQWDFLTQTPFVSYSFEGRRSQIWFDNLQSLKAKYALVRELGLRGVGMWNADTLDYSAVDDSQLMWGALIQAFASNVSAANLQG